MIFSSSTQPLQNKILNPIYPILLLAVIILLSLFASRARAAQVTLAWDPNSETDLAGYKMHYGTASGTYASTIDVGNTTTCTVPDLTTGTTYFFAVTAYTTSNTESGYSNEVAYRVPDDSTPPPVTLSSIAISGPTQLDENNSAQYACTARYSDDSTATLSSGVTWRENSSATTITSTGRLTAGNVSSDASVTITAAFGGKSDTHSVTITKSSTSLTGLSICGPAQVNEESSAQLACTAHYSDGKTSVVTDSVHWSVNSNFADINASGILSTYMVQSNEPLTITASFDGKQAEHRLTINDTTEKYTLTVDILGSGTVQLDPPGGTYDAGTVVTLTAEADHAWVFDVWTGLVSDTESHITSVVMDTSITLSAAFVEDTDLDSVPDHEEWGQDARDNAFDGNGDGIADYRQGNVASIHTQDYLHYLTLSVPETAKISACKTTDTTSITDMPAQYSLPLGLIDYRIENITPSSGTTLTIHLPAEFEFNTYIAHVATPETPSAHAYEFTYDPASQTGAAYESETLILHLMDGQPGDDDLTPNGILSSRGAPAILGAEDDPVDEDTTDPAPPDTNHYIEEDNSVNPTPAGNGIGCFISSIL